MRRPTLLAVAAMTALATTACLSLDSTSPAVQTDLTKVTFDTSLHVNLDSMTRTSNNVYFRDLVVGTGATAALNTAVTVDYDGWLTNGTLFATSSDPNAGPASFTIGSGYVIPGWDEGIEGMKVGGTRQLVIPPEMAYGSAGARSSDGTVVIPPNAVLVFKVTLVSSP